MEAVIFIGIQGSGKSTFYRDRLFDTHVRINLDMLRTRRREQILFDACLAAQQSFVIDNTNPTKADRARYMAAARAAGFRIVAYFFKSAVREAIQRNNQRKLKAKIPPAAIAATFKKLEPPSLEEGFDELFAVEVAPEGGFSVLPSAPRIHFRIVNNACSPNRPPGNQTSDDGVSSPASELLGPGTKIGSAPFEFS